MNLFDIPIISVALAVIISWALFAIFCGFIIEAFAQLKSERGRFMKTRLLEQLNDVPNGINWGSLLYLHGNIDMLSTEPGKPTSDINPKLFAETIIDVVANAQIVQIQPYKGNDLNHPSLSNFMKATQTLQPSNIMRLFAQALESARAQGSGEKGMDENIVYKKLSENLENWYNELTQRLSLWYKKKTKTSLFWIGAILALILNVDSIQLFQIYNADAATRSAVITYYEQNRPPLQTDSAGKTQQLKNLAAGIDSLKKQTLLPVGFDRNVFNASKEDAISFWFWFWKILGILITGFAASFGGPFWFDALKKLYSKKI